MATLGKALGGYGAFVAGSAEVVEWLLQRARTYIYSTALPPMAAAAASCALDLVDGDPTIIASLRNRIGEFAAAMVRAGLPSPASRTAIQPVVVGAAERALQTARRLHERGFLVAAIRPPTVPEGTSRLRISLSAAHSREEVESLAASLAQCLPS
jgi:8-amino-7-oxononanoate synthase